MILRPLKTDDAPLMLEWMHDPDVVKGLKANFMEKTLADCLGFIESTRDTEYDIHLAIADDRNEYMGTASLKHIDREEGTAEFAISIRRTAMGRGYSRDAMAELLRRGIEEMSLRKIYWCVSRKNPRAVRFYDKNGYQRTESIPENLKERYRDEEDLLWYIYE